MTANPILIDQKACWGTQSVHGAAGDKHFRAKLMNPMPSMPRTLDGQASLEGALYRVSSPSLANTRGKRTLFSLWTC